MQRYTAALTSLLICVCLAGAQAEKKAEPNEAATPKKVQLFNGKDLEGLMPFVPEAGADAASVWEVREGGVLHCKGKPSGYIRTKVPYENYRLTFEWRWLKEGGNSGVLLHIQEQDLVWPKSIEGQLASKNAADLWVIEGTDFKEHTNKDDRRVPKMHEHNEKPLGEWNQYEAVCDGTTIRLTINGLLQNVATETTVTKGYIGFQSEGTPIEFRNITLEPLSK